MADGKDGVGGFVTRTAPGHGREIGGVGFEEQAVFGNEGDGLAQGAVGGVADGPGDGDMPAVVQDAARQSRAAAEAVPEERVALKVAGFQRHEAFAFGVAAVNDHGQGQLAGKVELGGKGLVLNFPGAVVPVKVEADFPDGPETGLGGAGGADGVEGFGSAALWWWTTAISFLRNSAGP